MWGEVVWGEFLWGGENLASVGEAVAAQRISGAVAHDFYMSHVVSALASTTAAIGATDALAAQADGVILSSEAADAGDAADGTAVTIASRTEAASALHTASPLAITAATRADAIDAAAISAALAAALAALQAEAEASDENEIVQGPHGVTVSHAFADAGQAAEALAGAIRAEAASALATFSEISTMVGLLAANAEAADQLSALAAAYALPDEDIIAAFSTTGSVTQGVASVSTAAHIVTATSGAASAAAIGRISEASAADSHFFIQGIAVSSVEAALADEATAGFRFVFGDLSEAALALSSIAIEIIRGPQFIGIRRAQVTTLTGKIVSSTLIGKTR